MSTNLTKEQMRAARLIALGAPPDNQTATSPEGQSSEDPVGKKQARANTTRVVNAFELDAIEKIVYRGGNATEEDMLRWYNQGFTFCDVPSYGLKQGNGGPCGILAVVQAEMLREMLFKSESALTELPTLTVTDQQHLLATAICTILQRASENGPIHFVNLAATNWDKSMQQWELSGVTVTSYGSIEEAQLELEGGELQDLLGSRMGCVALLLSLVLSRGLERVVADMDDSSNTRKYLPLLLVCIVLCKGHSNIPPTILNPVLMSQ